jgi:hypothetical protein
MANSGTTTLPSRLVATYTLPPIVTSAVGAGVIPGALMPGIFEKGIVDVAPDTVLMTTTPEPLGA